jgi:hypothetical protein
MLCCEVRVALRMLREGFVSQCGYECVCGRVCVCVRRNFYLRGVCIVNDGKDARVGEYGCLKVFAHMDEVLRAVCCLECVMLGGACCVQWIAWPAPL